MGSIPTASTILVKLYNIYGRYQNKKVEKYLIKWGAKSRSKLQFTVKQFLKTFWRNQSVYEEFPVYGTRLKVDILNATIKVAIEVNGPQHSSFNKFFHGNSRAKYLSSIKRDHQKATWLEENGYKLIELEENDMKNLSKKFIETTFEIKM